jgi:hypothetical protein
MFAWRYLRVEREGPRLLTPALFVAKRPASLAADLPTMSLPI